MGEELEGPVGPHVRGQAVLLPIGFAEIETDLDGLVRPLPPPSQPLLRRQWPVDGDVPKNGRGNGVDAGARDIAGAIGAGDGDLVGPRLDVRDDLVERHGLFQRGGHGVCECAGAITHLAILAVLRVPEIIVVFPEEIQGVGVIQRPGRDGDVHQAQGLGRRALQGQVLAKGHLVDRAKFRLAPILEVAQRVVLQHIVRQQPQGDDRLLIGGQVVQRRVFPVHTGRRAAEADGGLGQLRLPHGPRSGGDQDDPQIGGVAAHAPITKPDLSRAELRLSWHIARRPDPSADAAAAFQNSHRNARVL